MRTAEPWHFERVGRGTLSKNFRRRWTLLPEWFSTRLCAEFKFRASRGVRPFPLNFPFIDFPVVDVPLLPSCYATGSRVFDRAHRIWNRISSDPRFRYSFDLLFFLFNLTNFYIDNKNTDLTIYDVHTMKLSICVIKHDVLEYQNYFVLLQKVWNNICYTTHGQVLSTSMQVHENIVI